MIHKKFKCLSGIVNVGSNTLISKYDFDNLLDIKLINLGFNEWSFSGDINAAISSESYITDIETIFLEHVESIISKALENLVIDTTNTLITKIYVTGINTYEDYKISKDKLFFVGKDVPHYFHSNTKELKVLYFFGGSDS